MSASSLSRLSSTCLAGETYLSGMVILSLITPPLRGEESGARMSASSLSRLSSTCPVTETYLSGKVI